MKNLLKLIGISLFGGVILLLVLKNVLNFTGNKAYFLLFNFDYVPVIKNLKPIWLFGYIFHFLTSMVSVIVIFYVLQIWNWQEKIWPYVLIYTLAGGALFFVATLSKHPPAANDVMAWIYWTLAHAIFGWVVGSMIKRTI